MQLVKPKTVNQWGHKAYQVEDVDALRDLTNVGDYISFLIKKRSEDRLEDAENDYRPKWKQISGRVKEKYPHIFILSNGKCYQWKDYLLGQDKHLVM